MPPHQAPLTQQLPDHGHRHRHHLRRNRPPPLQGMHKVARYTDYMWDFGSQIDGSGINSAFNTLVRSSPDSYHHLLAPLRPELATRVPHPQLASDATPADRQCRPTTAARYSRTAHQQATLCSFKGGRVRSRCPHNTKGQVRKTREAGHTLCRPHGRTLCPCGESWGGGGSTLSDRRQCHCLTRHT